MRVTKGTNVPAKKSRKGRSATLADTLRAEFRASGLTCYRVAKNAGISPQVLGRFLAGERDLRLATADKVARALGLELRQRDE